MDLIGDCKNFQGVINSIHEARERIQASRPSRPWYIEEFPEEMLIRTLRKDGQERRPVLKNSCVTSKEHRRLRGLSGFRVA